MTVLDVIVIGGGIAGLYASLKCCEAGLSVCTFEKDGRWGGRIRTIYNGTDHYEAGAARFHKNHRHIFRLLKRYHIDVVPLDKRPREYRASTCHSKGIESPAYAFISQIIRKSKEHSASFLRSITFGEFAEIVLGATNKEIAKSSFGYDGEFDAINAYDGIQMFAKDFDSKETYYVCKDGMSSLVQAIVRELEISSWVGHLEHRVDNIQRKDGVFAVTAIRLDGTKIRRKARCIIVALPKEALSQLYTWNREQTTAIDTVIAVPCERIYAKYSTSWYAGSPIVTTDLPIRQFIPITDNLAMVSYSDSKHADEWNHTASLGEKKLTQRLHGELRELFPEKKVPAKPLWIDSYYWKDAIHMWKPNVNSTKSRKHIQTGLWEEANVPFYVCGEAYSSHQCWVNGALESVEQIMPIVRKHFTKQAGGDSWTEWVRNKKTFTKKDLQELRKLYPEAKWVLFKDRLIDLTQWYYAHPGGQTPFDNHMYKDVYPFFKKISNHFDVDKKDIKDDVMKKIERLTITRVST